MRHACFRLPLLAVVTVILPAVLLLSGCKTGPAYSPNQWQPNRQTRDNVTNFFLVFPPKDESLWKMPNQTLPQGTPVLFLQTKRKYHQVQLQTLEIGYVPKGSLKQYR